MDAVAKLSSKVKRVASFDKAIDRVASVDRIQPAPLITAH